MKCPIHHVEFDELLWCPMCLIDEAEEYEEKHQEPLCDVETDIDGVEATEGTAGYTDSH
ncbi:hypothetical protein LCGC14_1879100 [marine sediment metagenome]|uniref:Uncharacterized protein n=1 Tax=marine sediment metagenome TaxID=412755 RepID=A0A0F9IGU2_9ZZZZ